MWKGNFILFIIIYYEQWWKHFGHFKKFDITQKCELYFKRKLMKFLTTYIHDVYHQSVVLKLLAILFHYWHIFILFLTFPLSAVRNGKFESAQEPIKSLDFTFRTACQNSHFIIPFNDRMFWLENFWVDLNENKRELDIFVGKCRKIIRPEILVFFSIKLLI